MNRLLSITEAATYCQNLPLTYFRNQVRTRHRPSLRAGFGQAHLLLRRRLGSVDADLGTHCAQKEGCGA